MHSLTSDYGLIDGNKMMNFAALIAFLGMNAGRLRWFNDDAYAFIRDAASGRLDDVSDIADRIASGSEER